MAVLSAATAIGATSITVDSVSGLSTDPQFQIVVGSEVTAVTAISGTTLTVTALTAAHKKGEPVAMYDRFGTAYDQLTGSVKIDAEGLTTRDSLLAVDYGGESLTASSGIVGPWTESRYHGLINGGFDLGADTGTLTAATIVGTASTVADYEASLSPDIPYWIVSVRSGNCNYERVTASSVTRFRVNGTGTATTPEVRIIQDLPVSGGGTVAGVFRYSHVNLTGATITVRCGQRDANHAQTVAATTVHATATLTGSASPVTVRFDGYDVDPATRFVRVDIQIIGTSAAGIPATASVTLDVIELAFDSGWVPFLGIGKLYVSDSQSITNSTWTTVTGYSGTIFDTGNFLYSAGVISVEDQPGAYIVTAHCSYTSAAAGQRRIMGIGVNLADPTANLRASWDSSGFTNDGNGVSAIIFLNAFDTVEIKTFQTSGGNLNLIEARLALVRLGSK